MVNAHLAKKVNLHCRSHKDVSLAINPYNVSVAKIPEEIFLCFEKLRGLSRRSRYLCHEDSLENPEEARGTFDKHLKKAIVKLDQIMDYFAVEHSIQFDIIPIDCIELKKSKLKYFIYSNASPNLKVLKLHQESTKEHP